MNYKELGKIYDYSIFIKFDDVPGSRRELLMNRHNSKFLYRIDDELNNEEMLEYFLES